MVNKARILIVEDDPDWLEIYEMELEDDEYSIQTSQTVEDSLNKIKSNEFDVVVTDLRLIGDHQGGINILKLIKQERADIQVIIFTGFGSAEEAQQALKIGAYDYLTKPLDYNHARLTIKAALAVRRQYLDGISKRKVKIEGRLQFPERFIYSASPMRDVVHSASKQSENNDDLIILGASGTGRGLLAEAIHLGSKRSGFALVNCTSLSERTLESSLFGSFAEDNQTWSRGYFEVLKEGTIVLDGITSLSKRLQEKLLEVLESRQIIVESSQQRMSFGSRVIALDNIEIEDFVDDGLFLRELYNHFANTIIRVPSLRERKDEKYNDIVHLAQYFITKYASEPYPELSPDAREALSAYSFPGNVRELQIIIRTAVAKAKSGTITLQHLPRQVAFGNSKVGLGTLDLDSNNTVLCPHGDFLCDQTRSILAGYAKGNLIYLRMSQESPSGLAEQAYQSITSFGYVPQRHVSIEGKLVAHCAYCQPIQMSRYAIIDLSGAAFNLMYEVGLLHALGIPVLLIRAAGNPLDRFQNNLNVVEYTSVEAARKIIDKWLKMLSH